MPSFHYFPQSNTLEIPDIRQTNRIHPNDRDNVEVTGKKKKKSPSNNMYTHHLISSQTILFEA
jgi:hypothetical protein